MSPIIRSVWKLITATSAAALLAACASTPVPVVDYKADYDFTHVHKIAFYKNSGTASGGNPMQLSDIHRDRINEALKHTLTGKNFEVVEQPSQADMLISWHLATQDKTDIRTYETPSYGMGYGAYGPYNRYSMYNCWNCSHTQVSVHNYTQGTFIVDMIDPKLRKSVWRSVIQSKLKGERIKDQNALNEASDYIMADFPPGAVIPEE